MAKLAGTIHTSANVDGKGIIVRKLVHDLSGIGFIAGRLPGGEGIANAVASATFRRKVQHYVNIEITPAEHELVKAIALAYRAAPGASAYDRMLAAVAAMQNV